MMRPSTFSTTTPTTSFMVVSAELANIGGGKRLRYEHLGRPNADNDVGCPGRFWSPGLAGLKRHEPIHGVELAPMDVGSAVAYLLGCSALVLCVPSSAGLANA